MKKTLIIALCSLAVAFAACKKPVEPTPEPEPVDYTVSYVGDYLGQITLTITSMNNTAITEMAFPLDSIRMDITKGEEANTLTATVTIDNEAYQTGGSATPSMADFDNVHLILNKPDFSINCDIKLVALPAGNDTLDLRGNFYGNGTANIMGQEQIFDEISGTVLGNLKRQ